MCLGFLFNIIELFAYDCWWFAYYLVLVLLAFVWGFGFYLLVCLFLWGCFNVGFLFGFIALVVSVGQLVGLIV